MKSLLTLLIPLLLLSSCTTGVETTEKPLVDSGHNFVYSPTGESSICQIDASGAIPSSCSDQDFFLFYNAQGSLALPEKKDGKLTVQSQLFPNDLMDTSFIHLDGDYYRNTNYIFHEWNTGGEWGLYLIQNADAKNFQLHTINTEGPTIGTQSGIIYGTDGRNTYVEGATLNGTLSEKEIMKYLQDEVDKDLKGRGLK